MPRAQRILADKASIQEKVKHMTKDGETSTAKIRQLDALRAQGFITDEEYENKIREITGEGGSAPQGQGQASTGVMSPDQLESMRALGFITDEEYARKKREIGGLTRQRPGTMPPAQATPRKRNKKVIIPIAIAGGVCLILAIVLPIVLLGQSSGHGRLELGQETALGSQTVAPEGGIIVINGSSSELNGMTITVPEAAYDTNIDFSISETEIKSQTFGDELHPITPLISVDNKEVLAFEPLEIKIPIKIEDDEFALGFYYDQGTGTLEGIPLLEQSSSSITLVTKHFSDFFIGMVKKGVLLGRVVDTIDTTFKPGTDDFIMPNYGSSNYRGNCAGQSIAALYYFGMKRRVGWEIPLHKRFDNNDLKKSNGEPNSTPAFWQDDAKAIRFCSAMQQAFNTAWNRNGSEMRAYFSFKNEKNNDENQYYALAYAMMETHMPQLLSVSNQKSGHMIIAYKIEGDTIYVADPNRPGEERTITLDRIPTPAKGGTAKFIPYLSGDDATSNRINYTTIAYFGTSAMVDTKVIYDYWTAMLKGQDLGLQLLPPDPQINVCVQSKTDLNTAQQKTLVVPIKNNLEINKSEMTDLGQDAGKLLYTWNVGNDPSAADYRLTAYIGDKEAAVGKTADGAYFTISLKPGDNDVGFLFEKKCTYPGYEEYNGFKFINFLRFNIKSLEGEVPSLSTSVEPSPSPSVEMGFIGSWKGTAHIGKTTGYNMETYDLEKYQNSDLACEIRIYSGHSGQKDMYNMEILIEYPTDPNNYGFRANIDLGIELPGTISNGTFTIDFKNGPANIKMSLEPEGDNTGHFKGAYQLTTDAGPQCITLSFSNMEKGEL
jgi:hypothetical protein